MAKSRGGKSTQAILSRFHSYLNQIESALKRGTATEHTYRSALEELLESFGERITATNEPTRQKCGAPDLVVEIGQAPLGYVETKDVNADLLKIEKDEQLKRYKNGLGNLILTDYLTFRWYVLGVFRAEARIATAGKNRKLVISEEGIRSAHELLNNFLREPAPTIASPKELAERMAAITRFIRDAIRSALAHDDKGGKLSAVFEEFKNVLLHDLTGDEFADMYAQTLSYGFFAARCAEPTSAEFSRDSASRLLPQTNPFLRSIFSHLTGPVQDVRINWAVEDLVALLKRAKMSLILKDFGKLTRKEDPIVHFYETFLAAYDPTMREARGVYYTPLPVVDFITRSVDTILKNDFGVTKGLADTSKVSVVDRNGKSVEQHRVLILDPATGTGTFLHSVIDLIRETFEKSKGAWSEYVRQHVLPRTYGFELLMAPYTVAHMKLGMQLGQSGYDFKSDERLGVYLTNTLDEAQVVQHLGLGKWLSDEARAASNIKRDCPIMVILGNPPYSGHSKNTGEWIAKLLRGQEIWKYTGPDNTPHEETKATEDYFKVDGKPLGERNPKWLNDDYVKFMRFAQWRIERTGHGILAFITNNGYIDNPTFRGMRQSLMRTFDDIYILDLHGNSKKKERTPDGGKDENVFDIQQGVAIGIFVKRPGGGDKPATVFHTDVYGEREKKYEMLGREDVGTLKRAWKQLVPSTPFYLFVPQDTSVREEYDKYWKITDVMPVNVLGFQTHRDHLAIAFDREAIEARVKNLIETAKTDTELLQAYDLTENDGWKLSEARRSLRQKKTPQSDVIHCLYRPFDHRWCYFNAAVMDRPRRELQDHVAGKENLCLISSRQQGTLGYRHAWVSREPVNDCLISNRSREANQVFPLYLYPAKGDMFDVRGRNKNDPRTTNFSDEFRDHINAQFKSLSLIATGKGDLKKTIGPEDVFHWLYAMLYSPTYRSRYAEFLKIDFPRIPLTSNVSLFRTLCELGEQLTGLHLMDAKATEKDMPGFPVASENGETIVEKVRYTEPTGKAKGRVWINKTQYFDGVSPAVWDFRVGGYQPCEKWLKDRKSPGYGGLAFDDIEHYQHIVAALAETIRVMEKIDQAIDTHGGWPIR